MSWTAAGPRTSSREPPRRCCSTPALARGRASARSRVLQGARALEAGADGSSSSRAPLASARRRRGDDRGVRPGRPRHATLATWLDGRACCRTSNTSWPTTPCRAMVGREFALRRCSGVHARVRAGHAVRGEGLRQLCGALADVDRPRGASWAWSSRSTAPRSPTASSTEALLQDLRGARRGRDRTRAAPSRRCRRSEASYRAIFDAAEDAIFVHDWDTGAILDVNAEGRANCSATRARSCSGCAVADISVERAAVHASGGAAHIERAKQSACSRCASSGARSTRTAA